MRRSGRGGTVLGSSAIQLYWGHIQVTELADLMSLMQPAMRLTEWQSPVRELCCAMMRERRTFASYVLILLGESTLKENLPARRTGGWRSRVRR